MVNGVLVERTVTDVLPALKTNAEGLQTVLADLLKQYKQKEQEMEKWRVSFNYGCRGFAVLTQICAENESRQGCTTIDGLCDHGWGAFFRYCSPNAAQRFTG